MEKILKPWNVNRVITKVNTRFGAPMGRFNKGNRPNGVVSGRSGSMFKKHQPKIYDKKVTLIDGYDKGGVYWGVGSELRVEFTPNLEYVRFYRVA